MSMPATLVTKDDMFHYDDFVLSTRGRIDEKSIKQKIPVQYVPLIIDISINGYSNRKEFDIEVSGKKFSEFKSICSVAVKDGDTLTVKRACRVTRLETQKYIEEHNIKTPLFRKYSKKTTNIEVSKYAFIGGEHSIPIEIGKELIDLWILFDEEKGTKISDSVKRVIEARK